MFEIFTAVGVIGVVFLCIYALARSSMSRENKYYGNYFPDDVQPSDYLTDADYDMENPS